MSLRQLYMSPKSILFAVILIDVIAVAAGLGIAAVRGLPVTAYVAPVGYMDYMSFAHLLLMAFFAFLIFNIRCKQRSMDKLDKKCLFWAIIGLGSVLLAADQWFWLHDNIGTWVVNLLGIQSSSVVDRAGDFILLFFIIIALLLSIIFKSEIIKYKSAFPVLIALIPVLLVLVILYALTTTTDILDVLVTGPESVEGCFSWL